MCQLLFWLCSQQDNRGTDAAVAADVRSRPWAGQRHTEGTPSLFAQWRGRGCGRRRAKPSVGGAGPRRRAAKPVRPVARQTCEAVRRRGRAAPKGRQDCSPSGADAAVAADVRRKKYGMSYSSRRRTDTPRFAVPLRLTRLFFRRAHLDLITAEYRPAFSPGLSACGRLAADSSAVAFLSRPPRPSTSRRLAFRASRKEFSASQLAMQFPVSIPRDGRSVKICGGRKCFRRLGGPLNCRLRMTWRQVLPWRLECRDARYAPSFCRQKTIRPEHK